MADYRPIYEEILAAVRRPDFVRLDTQTLLNLNMIVTIEQKDLGTYNVSTAGKDIDVKLGDSGFPLIARLWTTAPTVS